VAEPFRDGLEAAMERAERLADENEDLRDEVERLKHDAAYAPLMPAPTTAATAPPDGQEERILHLLDDLAKERDDKPLGSIAEELKPLAMPETEAQPHAEDRVRIDASPDVLAPGSKRSKKLEDLAKKPEVPELSVEERVHAAFKTGMAVGFAMGAVLLIAVLIILLGR
jgi:cell division septum initiation protein DivIVA